MHPMNPRHARLLAATAFEEAAELAQDGHPEQAIVRAQEAITTLLERPINATPA